MSPIFAAATRQRSISILATLSLSTTATAQAVGQIAGVAPKDSGGMMGGGWGWGMGHGGYGMGGYGLVGIILLALAVIAVAVMAFRRRQP